MKDYNTISKIVLNNLKEQKVEAIELIGNVDRREIKDHTSMKHERNK